jgi:DNA-binding XRE family transcriptional regulator
MNDYFWGRVKRLLKENRVTHEMAAAACGVKLKTFRSWMRKDYYPTILGGYDLACLLGVSVEYLVTGRDRKGKKQLETVRFVLKNADDKLKRLLL